MSRFDLHPTQSRKSFLLDVQTDYLVVQRTRMMIPVLPVEDMPERVRGLHLLIQIDEKPFVVATHLMAAVPTRLLLPADRNLSELADDITRALDLLFQGY